MMQVAGNEHGVTAFQMDIKVVFSLLFLKDVKATVCS